MAWIAITGSLQAKSLQADFQEALRGLAGSWTIDVMYRLGSPAAAGRCQVPPTFVASPLVNGL